MRVLRQEKKTSRWSAQGRARRGEAPNLITCAETCGGCMRLFILALERSDIPAPLLFAPPRTKRPPRPLQQRMDLTLSSRNLFIDVLLSPSLLSHKRAELVSLASRLLERRLSSSALVIPGQRLGCVFYATSDHVRPKYRTVDLGIYVDLIGHYRLCPGKPTSMPLFVSVCSWTCPLIPPLSFKYAHSPFISGQHCHQCFSISI
jgi:hypothetical protein